MKKTLSITFENDYPVTVTITSQNKSEETPLYCDETERLILGGIMQNNQLWEDVSSLIHLDSFHSEKHRQIFSCIQALAAREECLDVVTILEALDCGKLLDSAGGIDYVITLAKTAYPFDIKKSALALASAAKQRHLLETTLKSIELFNSVFAK